LTCFRFRVFCSFGSLPLGLLVSFAWDFPICLFI
jgi:hypothetical protein